MPSTIGIVASGEDVLNDAVFWVDAGRSSVVSGALSNLGTGGSALNAVFGNSTGNDSFDPALLTHTGTNYLHLPGVTGNYASTPDSTALDVIGDLELVAYCASNSWISAAFQTLLAKRLAAPQQSYLIRLNGTAGLDLVLSADGTTVASASSTATLSSVAVNGTPLWIKVTYRASDRRVQFFYALAQLSEPSTWTQLGTDVTHTISSVFASTAPLEIGSRISGTADPFIGNFYRAIVRNGIGGTTVFDADFTTGITSGAQTTFIESSANAATVTINRSTSGRKAVAVTRPILLFGTDDYLEVADNDLLDFGASDSFTVVAVVRQWATPTSFGRIIDKKNGGGVGVGWDLTSNGTAVQPAFFIGDATNGANRTGAVSSAGTLQIVSGIVNRSAQTAQLYTNNTPSATTSTTAVGSLANSLPMRIGIAANTLGSASDIELVAAAVWRRALNANEIATIVARYT